MAQQDGAAPSVEVMVNAANRGSRVGGQSRSTVPASLFGIALLVRLAFALLYPDPGYPDSYYYVNVARELASGRGFNIDFIWTFVDVGGRLPERPQLPIPSNAHWMPLASVIQVPFIWLFGPEPVASALPFLLIGALAAPLTWLIAVECGAPRWVGLGAALLAAVPGLATAFFAQPDNFGLFQVVTAGALLLASRGLKGDRASLVAAGAMAGLATLSRADGVLLLGVVALTFVWTWRPRGRPAGAAARSRLPLWVGAATLAAFLTVVGPWWYRQLDVFGSISPSSASGRILWIRTLDQMNSITTDASLAGFLDQGLGSLIASRLGGLGAAITIFVVMGTVGLLVIPMVVGGWRRRRSASFGPFFAYAAVLFTFSATLSSVHVPNGTFIHSAVALVPHGYVLALEGVGAIVAAVARRRAGWQPERAAPRLGAVLVTTVALAGIAFGFGIQADWDAERGERIAIDLELDARGVPGDERLMAIDAGGYRYFTGRPTVVTPGDDLGTIERVARAYSVRWLVLERDEIVPALEPVLDGEVRPPWLATAVYTLSEPGAVTLALYPVCTGPLDQRCSTGEDAPPVSAHLHDTRRPD